MVFHQSFPRKLYTGRDSKNEFCKVPHISYDYPMEAVSVHKTAEVNLFL